MRPDLNVVDDNSSFLQVDVDVLKRKHFGFYSSFNYFFLGEAATSNTIAAYRVA